MRHITFLGSKNNRQTSFEIEFAKWTRRVSPDFHQDKINLTRDIAKNKNIITPELRERIIKIQSSEKESNALFDLWGKIHRDKNIPGYNKKKNDAIYYADQEIRRDRIKKLSQKAKENSVNRETPFDRPVSKSAVKNKVSLSSSNPNPPKQNIGNIKTPTNNPSPKISSNSTKTPLLQAKKLPLRKLGLGAVGLVAVGAVGYGINRKIRSDKGKKRGRYFK